MKLTGNMFFIHRGIRNQLAESDIPDKFKVIDILRKHHLYGLTGEVIYFNRHTGHIYNYKQNETMTDEKRKELFWHKPDVFVKPDCVIEIDGWETHGGNDDISTTEDTKNRNAHYLWANLKLIVLDKMTLKVLGQTWQEFLEQDLRSHGMIA